MITIELPEQTRQNYQAALEALNHAGIPYVVGGAYALFHYTGLLRSTYDLDVCVTPPQVDATLRVLGGAGFSTWVEEAHWLAKAQRGADLVDVISGFGNWLAPIDETWLTRAEAGTVLGVPVRLAPVEEFIWSKAYVAARERYDGADIVHLINAAHDRIDWDHLLQRFAPHWELLLSHLLVYRFVYPSERDKVPPRVIEQLVEKLREQQRQPPPAERLCRGTLLDRRSFNLDVLKFGFVDPREQLAVARGYSPADVSRYRTWIQKERAAQ